MNGPAVAAAVSRLEAAADGSPDLFAAMTALVESLTAFTPDRDDPNLAAAVARSLRAEVSDAVQLGRVAGELLKLRHGDGDPAKLADAGASLAADPLGQALLCHALNVDGQVEVAVTRYRRRLLLGFARPAGIGAPGLHRLANRLRHGRPGIDPSVSLTDDEQAAVAAIARQGHDNDYVFAVAADEEALLDGIETVIGATIAAGPDWYPSLRSLVLLYAMYRRLARHPTAGTLAEVPDAAWAGPALAAIERTLREPREEIRLAGSVERVGEITDAVSAAVRAQYEENPYPHWRASPPVGPTRLPELIGAQLPGSAEAVHLPAEARILVAGCGTGPDAVALARRLPDAAVTGTDLSLPSLAYAMRRARGLGVSNLRLVQNDLLEVSKLGASFHYIECTGVLHHMDEPADGLAALAGVLEPGGIMRLGLYSRTARRLITAARARVRELGIEATPGRMRAYRQRILFGDEPEAIWGVMRYRDFYALSQFRDLLFHVQEHLLTLADVERMLAASGLELLGLDLPRPETAEAYRARFPDDPGMKNLANWDAFERDHPDTFVRMYQLWCRRSESVPGG